MIRETTLRNSKKLSFKWLLLDVLLLKSYEHDETIFISWYVEFSFEDTRRERRGWLVFCFLLFFFFSFYGLWIFFELTFDFLFEKSDPEDIYLCLFIWADQENFARFLPVFKKSIRLYTHRVYERFAVSHFQKRTWHVSICMYSIAFKVRNRLNLSYI